MVNGGWPAGIRSVLPMQQGVCSVCHQYNAKGWGECPSCLKVLADLKLKPIFRSGLLQSVEAGLPRMISVCPLFLRLKSEDIETYAYKYMYEYKNNRERSNQEARQFIQQLCEVAISHESCLANRLMPLGQEFDQVLTLPSKSGRHGIHPLNEIVSESAFGRRLSTCLTYLGPLQQTKVKRTIARSDWAVDEGLINGRSVLLLDDLWTTGGTALSAATALVQAGAKRVGVFTLGRHLDESKGVRTSRGFRQLTAGLEWSPRFCAFCDSRASAIANPPLPVESVGS